MERIPIRELNQHTSAVVARVRNGEVLEVTVAGRPVARLVPLGEGTSLLERWSREGKATAPTIVGTIPRPPVQGDPGRGVSEDLSAARSEERW